MAERRPQRRALAFRRAAAIGIVAGLAAIVVLLLLGSGGESYRYRLLFENAGQLVGGNQVLIGGHRVGSVEAIDLTDDGQAEIGIAIDQQLHVGSTATIRNTSLAGVANRYISVSPGPNSEPALDSGAVLDQSVTTPAVDLDALFNAFTPRTRSGLANFIKGQAAIYEGQGERANRSYKYLEPALSQTNAVLAELNRDRDYFKRFILGGARLFSAVAARGDDLSSSVANANQAFTAIASENRALDRSLSLLPPTFRQSNTAFVNLRAALDDLDSLVATAKPATEDLTPFLAKARPVVGEAIPVFRDLRLTVSSPGANNDLGELTALLPEVESRARPAFRRAIRAIAAFQPTLEFARPYAPEMLNGLARLGQITANYDANGHYARALVSDLGPVRLRRRHRDPGARSGGRPVRGRSAPPASTVAARVAPPSRRPTARARSATRPGPRAG